MRPHEIDPARNMTCGNTLLNAGTLTMHVEDRHCDLTASEFRLLQVLFSRPSLLLPKQVVMDILFDGHSKRPGEGILRVYTHRVRKHLLNLRSDLTINTRHGIGWILVVPVPAA